jgi:hypothetical protein
MNLRGFLCAGVAIAALGAASPAIAKQPAGSSASQTAPTPAPSSTAARGTTVYQASFFAQFAPRTAYDIVQHIPAFTLDLGANNSNLGGNTDIRGFAGVAGNVVINGQRPSTKSERLDSYLNRIPASRVIRVEVGPGDLYGADYSSKSQVANLVLAEGGGAIAGNVTVTAERHFTGTITPTANGSVSISRGPSTFNIAGDTALQNLTEKGLDTVTNAMTGELIESRRKINVTDNYSPFISASWALDKGASDSANLNIRYHFDHFKLHQFNHVYPVDAPEHFDTLVEDYPTKTFELGGDVTRPLFGGAIKFVGLASRQKRHTLDEYDIGNIDHSQVVGGFQQLSDSQRNETLGRLTWTKSKVFGFQFEAGGEVAWNTLDDDLQLFAFDEQGDKIQIPLPIDNARVTELRGEFWVNGSRPLSKTVSMSLGMNYETSVLKVSGDASAERRLKFLKPSMTVDWQAGAWHTQFILRRTVAQLDFYDFISAADLAAGQINGGNANLEPQRSWEARLSAEHPLFGEGKARLELGYNLISKLQDRILICDPNHLDICFDAPGNIGTGRQMYADLTFDAPLDRFWKGLRVKLHGNVQQTRVEDPISGELRDFSGFFPRWQWDADIRRDIGKWAYGFQLSDRRRTTLFRTDTLDTRYNIGFPYTYAFVEYRPTQAQSVKLYFDDISNTGGARDLLIYLPNRTAGEPSILDHRFRNSHVRVGITFNQSFGGGGGKASASGS